MYDYQDFSYHKHNHLERGCYRVFEPDGKAKVLEWFSSKDVSNNQKEELIYRLILFQDDCGGYFRYRAFFLTAEAIALFKVS